MMARIIFVISLTEVSRALAELRDFVLPREYTKKVWDAIIPACQLEFARFVCGQSSQMLPFRSIYTHSFGRISPGISHRDNIASNPKHG